MPEEETITRAKTKFNGLFNLKDFYAFFYDVIISLGYEVHEIKYKQKEDPNAGNELEINWECEKKVDDYTKFKILVHYFVTGLKSIQVQKGNATVKTDKGDIELTLKAILRTDYEGRWETNPFLKFTKKLFENYLYRSTYDQWKKKIYDEMYSAHNEAKAFFNLQRMNI